MRTPLEDDDIQLGPATFCLGGGAHPRSIAADDDQSFLAHGSFSFIIAVESMHEYRSGASKVPA